MKENEQPNWGTMVNPESMYPVSYTIDQNGNKHYGQFLLKGNDMTEAQIKELFNNVDLDTLLK